MKRYRSSEPGTKPRPQKRGRRGLTFSDWKVPMICPCGSGKNYSECCEIYISGSPAPTAEALMRSRYTAFVVEDEPYLLKTWDPRTRPPRIVFEPEITWTGLEILKTVKGGADDTMGMVHFRAHFQTADGKGSQEERSKFLRPEAGAPWIYVD